MGKGRLLALPYTRSSTPRKREEYIFIYKALFRLTVIFSKAKFLGILRCGITLLSLEEEGRAFEPFLFGSVTTFLLEYIYIYSA